MGCSCSTHFASQRDRSLICSVEHIGKCAQVHPEHIRFWQLTAAASTSGSCCLSMAWRAYCIAGVSISGMPTDASQWQWCAPMAGAAGARAEHALGGLPAVALCTSWKCKPVDIAKPAAVARTSGRCCLAGGAECSGLNMRCPGSACVLWRRSGDVPVDRRPRPPPESCPDGSGGAVVVSEASCERLPLEPHWRPAHINPTLEH